MTKVTVHKKDNVQTSSPSADIVRDANKTFAAFDSLGRKILVKMPSFQDNMRYDLYFGKYDGENKKFYESNKFILFVKEIDDVPVAFPTKESEALALAARLGNEGFLAIMNCIAENFNLSEPNEQQDDEVKATLKK